MVYCSTGQFERENNECFVEEKEMKNPGKRILVWLLCITLAAVTLPWTAIEAKADTDVEASEEGNTGNDGAERDEVAGENDNENRSSAEQEAANESREAEKTEPYKEDAPVLKTYKITGKYEDGTKIDVTTVEEGSIPKHADPVMKATAEYTYEFIGWDREPAKVTGPATYTAMFRRIKNKYAVHFESNGGSAVAILTVEYGKLIERPADPEREGYTFEGWYADENLIHVYDFEKPIVAETTVYAKWTEEKNAAPDDSGTNVIPGEIAVGTEAETTVESAPKGDGFKKYVIGGAALAALLIGVAVTVILRKRH